MQQANRSTEGLGKVLGDSGSVRVRGEARPWSAELPEVMAWLRLEEERLLVSGLSLANVPWLGDTGL